MKKKLLTNKEGQVRELTHEDIQAMKSASEMLPADLVAILPTPSIMHKIINDTLVTNP